MAAKRHIIADETLRLVDVDETTEEEFLRCMHLEKPIDPRLLKMRRDWYERFLEKGLRAKVLLRGKGKGEMVGLCQYLPIEHSHFAGEGMMTILCLWVHGHDHLVGNQQGKGYGRYMLEKIEEDAGASGMTGVAAWGMDNPVRKPVSFYLHMGYRRVDNIGPTVLVWKPFMRNASPPAFMKKRPIAAPDDEVTQVTVFRNSWCMNACGNCLSARDAVEGLEASVAYQEIDTSRRANLLAWGIDNGIYINGEPHNPFGPPSSFEDLRTAIQQRAKN